MPRLLNDQSSAAGTASPVPGRWFVGGKRYTNTAARFWLALLDEIAEDFPACACAMFRATDDQPLTREQLAPVNSLERALQQLETADLQAAMQQALLELEVAGPPPPISLELYTANKELLLRRSLPRSCVDTEIFPFLLVWLLEWAELPVESWNRESVSGGFAARDPVHGFHYRIELELANRHLCEGLFERVLTLHCQRGNL